MKETQAEGNSSPSSSKSPFLFALPRFFYDLAIQPSALASHSFSPRISTTFQLCEVDKLSALAVPDSRPTKKDYISSQKKINKKKGTKRKKKAKSTRRTNQTPNRSLSKHTLRRRFTTSHPRKEIVIGESHEYTTPLGVPFHDGARRCRVTWTILFNRLEFASCRTDTGIPCQSKPIPTTDLIPLIHVSADCHAPDGNTTLSFSVLVGHKPGAERNRPLTSSVKGGVGKSCLTGVWVPTQLPS